MIGLKQLIACATILAALSWVFAQNAEPPAPTQPIQPEVLTPDVEPPTTIIPREGCVTTECHPGTKSGAILHGPLHVNACDSCHTLADAETHAFTPTRPKEESCIFCHNLDINEEWLVHEPLTVGECTSCHDPHGSDSPALLLEGPYSDTCTSCHEDQVGAKQLIHGPASAGACGACHDPHASPNRMLLSADGRDMCLRCHVTTGIEIDTLHVVHEPVMDNCQICHDPHATDNNALLRSDAAEMCESCHEDIKHTVETAKTQHGAVTTERECLNCHAPHASDRPSLLKHDARDLCYECHDEEVAAPDGSMLANMKAVIEGGTSLHGAIAQSNCVACHQIHGGDHSRLLTNEYPSNLYYPFNETIYALCFSCHDKQLVAEPETEVVTAFRNGTTNLHFLHVNRDTKGRSCRICHDSHAADRANHIRDEIPYGKGGWMLPIGFKPNDNGGSCAAGCHQAFEYNRDIPVIYPHTEDGKDWKGRDLIPGNRDPAAEPIDNGKGKSEQLDLQREALK